MYGLQAYCIYACTYVHPSSRPFFFNVLIVRCITPTVAIAKISNNLYNLSLSACSSRLVISEQTV